MGFNRNPENANTAVIFHGFVSMMMTMAPLSYWFTKRYAYLENQAFYAQNILYYTAWQLFFMGNTAIYVTPAVMFLILWMENDTLKWLYVMYFDALLDDYWIILFEIVILVWMLIAVVRLRKAGVNGTVFVNKTEAWHDFAFMCGVSILTSMIELFFKERLQAWYYELIYTEIKDEKGVLYKDIEDEKEE